MSTPVFQIRRVRGTRNRWSSSHEPPVFMLALLCLVALAAASCGARDKESASQTDGTVQEKPVTTDTGSSGRSMPMKDDAAHSLGPMPMNEGDGHGHSHDSSAGVEIEWSPPPQVKVTAEETKPGTVLVTIDVRNFELTDGTRATSRRSGHAHVYLDGREVGMAYSSTFQIESVPPGTHEVRVQLVDREHRTLLSNGKAIEAATELEVEGAEDSSKREIRIEIRSGAVVGGSRRHHVPLGSTVDLEVLSDRSDEVHVHGYDISRALRGGIPTSMTFEADIPGVFEIELHESGLRVGQLAVS